MSVSLSHTLHCLPSCCLPPPGNIWAGMCAVVCLQSPCLSLFHSCVQRFSIPLFCFTSLTNPLSSLPCPTLNPLIDYYPVSNPGLPLLRTHPRGPRHTTWVTPPPFVPFLPSYSSSFPWTSASETLAPGVGVRSYSSQTLRFGYLQS